jgi:hypothetical protein
LSEYLALWVKCYRSVSRIRDDGKRFVVCAVELLTALLELEFSDSRFRRF